jgi:hypothetical protein
MTKTEVSSFVEFDISSYLNMKLTSTDPLTEEFDINEARLVSPTTGCVLLDISVSICTDPPAISLEIPNSRPKEDDLFLTIKSLPRPSSVVRVSSHSNTSRSSFSVGNKEDSHEEIEVVDEEGFENMTKRELVERIKELKKQNQELKALQKVALPQNPPPNRQDVLENMIVVLKNDLATVLNAIQKDGNYHIFDEIKDKVSFFS